MGTDTFCEFIRGESLEDAFDGAREDALFAQQPPPGAARGRPRRAPAVHPAAREPHPRAAPGRPGARVRQAVVAPPPAAAPTPHRVPSAATGAAARRRA
jgi:hypothetical protein